MSRSRLAGGLFAAAVLVGAVAIGRPAEAAPEPSDRLTTDEQLVTPTTRLDWMNDASGWVRTGLGCAASVAADDLDDFFADRRGPLIGWDNPHVIQLGPEVWLWLVHDTYLDYAGTADDLHDVGGQLQNVAFLQSGRCFELIHRGTQTQRENFETGDGRLPKGHFLWPLGSEVHDGRLMVFWSQTVTADPLPPPGHGITRTPVATWLATYDVETLGRLSFDPAPNSGVTPQYVFAVASDERFSYLFGNTNDLNFWNAGGYANGPHGATRMYLARVPLGRLDALAEYWDGTGWTDKAHRAVPFSERFWAENTMQPRYLDGQWVSVVNRDGFYSWDIVIDSAENPWGPWTTEEVVWAPPRPAAESKNNYQPIVLPWSTPSSGLTIGISENAAIWDEAVRNPALYRPGFLTVDWPGDPVPAARAIVGANGGSTTKGR